MISPERWRPLPQRNDLSVAADVQRSIKSQAVFLSVGLFAPPNTTVIVALMLATLSVSGAIFLILELDMPFDGVIHISSAPMRNALEHLGQR